MRGFHSSSFDPPTLVVLEVASDECLADAQINRQYNGKARRAGTLCLAMEGERDPVRLHDGALDGLLPATAWRKVS